MNLKLSSLSVSQRLLDFFFGAKLTVQTETHRTSMWNSRGKQHERTGKSDACIGGNRASSALSKSNYL